MRRHRRGDDTDGPAARLDHGVQEDRRTVEPNAPAEHRNDERRIRTSSSKSFGASGAARLDPRICWISTPVTGRACAATRAMTACSSPRENNGRLLLAGLSGKTGTHQERSVFSQRALGGARRIQERPSVQHGRPRTVRTGTFGNAPPTGAAFRRSVLSRCVAPPFGVTVPHMLHFVPNATGEGHDGRAGDGIRAD